MDDKYELLAEITNKGAAAMNAGEFEQAEKLFMITTNISEKFWIGWLNLGIARDEISKKHGLPFEGKTAYQLSLKYRITPDALNNLALIYFHNECNFLEAEELLIEAVIRWRFEPAAYNLSLVKLMLACERKSFAAWSDAWRWYEHRPQTANMRGATQLWRGEPLEGKRLLVAMEQGAGDQIWSLRWVKMAHEMGAEVHVMGSPNILPLLAHQAYIHASYDIDAMQSVDVDYVTMAMSMPGLMFAMQKPPGRYVFVGDAIAKKFDRKRVGLCWSGSVTEGYQAWRNIPKHLLNRLVSTHPNIEWVSLQRDWLAPWDGMDCKSIRKCLNLLDTARLVETLDLVISVDTMMPHLAASMGIPVWLLNHWSSCWYWGPLAADGSDTCDPMFYRNVTQFRQPKAGAWSEPVEQLCVDFETLFGDQHEA